MTEAISTPTRGGRRLRAIVIAAAAAASVATSRPENPRDFPRWQLTSDQTYAHGCATVRAWIPKSGKEGFGISLEIESTADCTVAITRAHLTLTGRHGAHAELDVQPLPAAIELPGRSRVHTYVPFAFDNNEAWNGGLRDGVMTLEMTINGAAAPPWQMTAVHRLDGYHTTYERQQPIARPEEQ